MLAELAEFLVNNGALQTIRTPQTKSNQFKPNIMWIINLKLAFRNFVSDKTFGIINLVGLAISMAACLVIMQFVKYEWSYDRNSPHAENIWRVYNETINNDGSSTLDANTHSAIAPALKADLPEVTDYVRLYNRNVNEVVILEKDTPVKVNGVWMADPGFLQMFPQTFIAGNERNCLIDPYSVILTESIAQAIFGATDVIGKTIQIPSGVFNGTYTVQGIVKDPLPNTHLKFNLLTSYATRYAKGHEDNWGGYWEYTYFQTIPDVDPAKIRQQLTQYAEKHLKDDGLRLHMQAFTDIHLHSNLTYEIEPNGSARMVNFLVIIAILILFIAFFNYVNMMTAKALSRAKEVGVRKVIGASRKILITQFIVEGLLLNMAALLLALAVLPLFLNWFSGLTDRPLNLFFQFDQWLALVCLGILLSSVFVSCIYPAVVLSGYRPVQVLKGHFARSNEGQSLRKGLVVFQFACSTVLIISVAIIGQQLTFLKNHDLGLSLDQVVAIKSPGLDFRRDTTSFARLTAFQNDIAQLAGVQSLATSSIVPSLGISTISGGSSGIHRVNNPDVNIQAAVYYVDVSPDFFNTYDINFLAGDLYEVNNREAIHNNIIVNEAARRMFGFSNAEKAVGEAIAFDRHPDRHISIRGVVADFHIEGLQEPARPTLYYVNPRITNGYLSLKMEASQISSTLETLQKKWSSYFPVSPFEFWFLNEQFSRQYAAEKSLSQIFSLFATLAIFIACIGLFGLITFTAKQRTKEIGIRKILGATILHLIALLSKDILKLIIVAILIAVPLSWWFMDGWLQDFAYRIDINGWIFVIAGGITMMIALLTLSYQSIKVALANPVESLRSE